mmetsp:Transcript_42503/g.77137  ORF Transcript_42503/g.77137 Transcript_42503/m.77137 type:complete len:223 (+) Transcript_42503:113-781(+)
MPMQTQARISERTRALTAVTMDGYALRLASLELQKDREVVAAAVADDPYSLQFAALEMRNNKEIVLGAVSQFGGGGALKFASSHLKNDAEVVLMAMSSDPVALNYAEGECAVDLLRDENLIQQHMNQHYMLVISMLSGRSCALVLRQQMRCTKATIVHECLPKLGFDNRKQLAMPELLLNGDPVPELEDLRCWPGVKKGCVTEVQILLKVEGVPCVQDHCEI